MNAHKWLASKDGNTFYAKRAARRADGRHTTQNMHRLVLARTLGRDIAPGMEVDHINGDGLDNRRMNLREVTKAQNMRNCRRRRSKPTSRFLGVMWFKARGKWHAHIGVDGRLIHLGDFRTELEAAQAREAFISQYPELMARSNFNNTERTTSQ